MKTVLVTGASGFVGQALCAELHRHRHGFQVRAALRKPHPDFTGNEQAIVPALDEHTDWSAALQEVEVVIHLAARVHVMKDTSTDPLAEFRKVNVLGTENLARQAVRAGVMRLVYVSSIKVNGEETVGQQSYTEQDAPSPQDPYGVSKWEAEQALQRVAQETGLEVVIVRPPLVYGPGVKGNFISLLAAVSKGVPLPLAGADNARSLVYVGNLVDALIACATHPAAAGQTYLVSDGAPVSTAALVEKIAGALGCRSRSFYFPPVLMRAAAALLGRSAQVDRLFGSLRINDEKIRRELGWVPPYTLEQGLRATAEWYRDQR
ncbi:MAG: SDR family oxidoreductase [Gallionella sp.]|jgi:nucleoside-diphosphate-sugar epimerase|nr:SDR family oxidoreductase [Gallionella sp.]MCK9354132.1 SDR family oxidoreductase [Gallionella sp.]